MKAAINDRNLEKVASDVLRVSTPRRSKVTLNRIPAGKAISIRAMLDDGFSYKKIMQELGVCAEVIATVKKSEVLDEDYLERTKSRLTQKYYHLADSTLDFITPEKLESSSAPQLMTVSAIAFDKARLSDGLSTENLTFRNLATQISDDRHKISRRLAELGGEDILNGEIVDSQNETKNIENVSINQPSGLKHENNGSNSDNSESTPSKNQPVFDVQK